MKPIRIVIGIAVLAVLAVGALFVIQQLRSDDPNLATSAPELPTSAPVVTSGNDSSTPQATTTSPLASGTRHFVIDSSKSSAKYVVEETLNGIANAKAVGTTNDITGDIYLTPTGLDTSQKSSFKVDLRTLKSDETRRDNFIKMDTLQTNRFPFAEFTIESVSGFPTNYVANTEVQLSLTGTMTIHGVSKPLTFTVLARQNDKSLGATADTSFKFTDFGMSPPNVQIAQAKDAIQIQVVLIANEA